MATSTKIVLGLLLWAAILDMPDGYYEFLRISAFIGFAYLAKKQIDKKNGFMTICCIGMVILFNPIMKIHLGLDDWHFMDVAIAFFMGIWILADLILFFINKRRNSITLMDEKRETQKVSYQKEESATA